MDVKKADAKGSSTAKGFFTVSVKSAFFWSELTRKIVQILSFILFNGVILSFSVTPIVLPILYTLGSPNKIVGEAFGTLQWMIYDLRFPWLPLTSIFFFAILTGRFLCGWVCPFGFVQDILSYVKPKKLTISPKTHRDSINIKYLILSLTLLISSILASISTSPQGQVYRRLFGVFAKAPFTALSPSDTLFAVIPRATLYFYFNMYEGFLEVFLSVPTLFWTRLIVLAAVFILSTYVPRAWCRYFCPQGAFSALISRFSFLGLKREPLKCTKASCRTCVEVCPTKVLILDLPWEKITDPECIYCLRCVTACSTKAIKPKFP